MSHLPRTVNLNDARQMVLDYCWLKLGGNELLFDRVQLKRNESGKIEKGRWVLDESEGWQTLGHPRGSIF